MREILFRGKRIDDGEWVEGAYFPQNDTYPTTIFERHCAGYFVRSETVGQYTGLKDKNGKRIFEGDIVKAQDDLIFSPFCDGLVGKVVYIETAFFIEPKDPAKSEYLFNECAVYEVLGNIHDNGELMEDA